MASRALETYSSSVDQLEGDRSQSQGVERRGQVDSEDSTRLENCFVQLEPTRWMTWEGKEGEQVAIMARDVKRVDSDLAGTCLLRQRGKEGGKGGGGELTI